MTINQEIRENFKAATFIAVVVFLLVISAYPQHRMGGKVVQITNGKTVVIELFSGGKIIAELQHIEVPEAQQQFHQTVVAHLQKLVLNKNVEFRPLRIVQATTVGQINLNGVDISQQMIRDGAAWYSNDQTGQDAAESANYQGNEAQAKAEKRGIWSVEGLKPPWQIRFEAEEKRKSEAKIALEKTAESAFVRELKQKQKMTVAPKKQFNSEAALWSENTDVQAPRGVMNVGGLLMAHDPSGMLGFVGTPPLRYEIAGDEDAPSVVIGFFYFYADDGPRGMKKMYLVSVESESKDFNFLKNNNLVVSLGKQKINVGKAKRNARKLDHGVKEILTYTLKREFLEKVANAENVGVKVGNFDGQVNADIQTLLRNLLKMTE